MNNQDLVRDFHEKFLLTTNSEPTIPSEEDMALRDELIAEEFLTEYRDAVRDRDLVKIADALGDILYVVYGAGVTYGIDLQSVFEEIHRSNMSKLWSDVSEVSRENPDYTVNRVADGKFVVHRPDGKVVKPPGYSPPDLQKVMYADSLLHPE